MDSEKNNTSYPSLIADYIQNLENDPNNILFNYQNIVFNYLNKSNNRGLLIFHKTGSGKTRSSISIAEQFRKEKRDILILSSKSLKSNYIKEIENYNKQLDNKIKDEELNKIVNEYKFVTMNSSNMIQQLKKTGDVMDDMLYEINKFNLDDKVIIVDEAHNLFNSIVNGSKNATEFYDLVMKSKNIKILFLTGSPIINSFFELVPALNMCSGHIVLPEYYSDFKNMFIDETNNTIKNKVKLQSRILGLISYYGNLYYDKYIEFKQSLSEKSIKKEHFPIKLPVTIEKIEMSKLQNIEYNKYREIEKNESSQFYGGGIFKEQDSTSTSYRIRSRQVSNVFYGTNNKLSLDTINEITPKMKKIYENIQQHKNQLGLVYSSFLVNGIEYFAKVLILYGYNKYNSELKLNKTYAFYTGNQTLEEKDKILKIFNSIENINGEIISILLISSAGSEGLNLLNVRHVHIMEPYWNYARIHQVESRAIRYKSHDALKPINHTVKVYIYLSIYNEDFLNKEKQKIKDKIKHAKENKIKLKRSDLDIEKSTDVNIFMNSIKKKEMNDKFLQVLMEVSIECEYFNKGINFDCFKCKSTNEKLYNEDIYIDINLPSKCIQEKQIKTEEILFNGKKYYYDKKTLDIYYYHNKIDGYILLEDKIIKEKLLNKINK